MDPRSPYRPIGENPDPSADDVTSESVPPLPRSEDDDPANDESAAPDD
jgi:hypothetical protein